MSSRGGTRGVARLEFSNEAVADLDSIDDYSFAQFGEETASLYMRGFNPVFALLQEHPNAGPSCPQYGAKFRCFVHRRHRIFYLVENDVVLIVRILHHAMEAKPLLKDAGL